MDQIIILGPVMGTQPYPEVTAQIKLIFDTFSFSRESHY